MGLIGQKKIIFLHPDLGIGGAERLIVDAAIAYQQSGHKVHILTNHHDASRCFPETLDQLSVQVIGAWFPRSILGRLQALCAYIRMCLIALYLIFSHDEHVTNANLLFIDQISAPLIFLQFFKRRISLEPNFKMLFYCHFPDMLLTDRNTTLKSLYRRAIDSFEEYTTGLADHVLVNSQFTAGVFHKTFTSLTNLRPEVVYPTCNFEQINQLIDEVKHTDQLCDSNDANIIRMKNKPDFVFLSLNRYERKKNISLAIKALYEIQEQKSSQKCELWIAGGYDSRITENIEHFEELCKLAKELKLESRIRFFRSPSDVDKIRLLQLCDCVLYTPENEHFGIVPIEAMYLRRPVIACNSGGPLETVVNKKTGLHCESSASAFAAAMSYLLSNPALIKQMGENGHQHVQKNFSFDHFRQKLNDVLSNLIHD